MTDINLFITLAGTARHGTTTATLNGRGQGEGRKGGGSQCGVLSTQRRRRRRLPPVSFFNYAYILRV